MATQEYEIVAIGNRSQEIVNRLNRRFGDRQHPKLFSFEVRPFHVDAIVWESGGVENLSVIMFLEGLVEGYYMGEEASEKASEKIKP